MKSTWIAAIAARAGRLRFTQACATPSQIGAHGPDEGLSRRHGLGRGRVRIGAGRIAIRFHHGGTYLYDATRPGQRDVLAMQALAEAGEGLNTYINQHVRDRYAARLD